MVGVRRTALIVDDHEAFRSSARALLEAEGFDVIGEAADGQEAVETAAASHALGTAKNGEKSGPPGPGDGRPARSTG